MAEELRALMQAELSAERPPPLGDLVGDALRDGRRIRRNRRIGAFGSAAAVLAVLAAGAIAGWPTGPARGPGPDGGAAAFPASPETSVSPEASANPARSAGAGKNETPGLPETTMTSVPLRGTHATGRQKDATPQAVLELLTRTLPAGKTSHYVANADEGLFAQVYLDTGAGPGMVRVWLKPFSGGGVEKGHAKIEMFGLPDNCVQSMVVSASYATGGHLELNVATCLAENNRPASAPLTPEQALRVATDARWGMRMDADLVDAAERFADVPTSTE